MGIFLIPGLIIIALACLVYIQLHLSKAEEENKIKLDHDKSLCIDHQIQIALLKLVKYLTSTSNSSQHRTLTGLSPGWISLSRLLLLPLPWHRCLLTSQLADFPFVVINSSLYPYNNQYPCMTIFLLILPTAFQATWLKICTKLAFSHS